PAALRDSARAKSAEVARTVAMPLPNQTASESERSARAKCNVRPFRAAAPRPKLRSLLGAARPLQRVLLAQLLDQRSAIQSEDLGGLVLVPTRAPERLVDEAILEVGEHFVQIHALGRQRGGDLASCSVRRRLAGR